MRRTGKRVIAGLLLMVMVLAGMGMKSNVAGAKTTKKNVIITKLTNSTLKYRKSYNIQQLAPGAQWENIVGAGKQLSVKVAKNAKYYVLDYNTFKTVKASKSKFKSVVRKCAKGKEGNVVYYSGTACKVTIKNGKCVKFVQVYQA